MQLKNKLENPINRAIDNYWDQSYNRYRVEGRRRKMK